MRIAFVTPSLALGGYEKVVVSYANELCKRGHQVDILCGFKKGELLNIIVPGVNIIDFQARARSFVFPLISYLKKHQVDVLYCGFRSYNCIGVLAKTISRSNTCVYASQHGFEKDRSFLAFIKGKIICRADFLTAVTQKVAEYEAEELKIDVNRFSVLNNPVINTEQTVKMSSHPWFDDEIPIIAVNGRFVKDKGQKFCISILKKLNEFTPIRMMMLGDGPELEACKRLAISLGIENRVEFMGYVSNPNDYMVGCNLLLHTALEEGFGNIIVEALSVGIPVCSTNCSGPMHIIQDGKYGVNLGNVDDVGFVDNSARKILDVINGNVHFEGLKERAYDFDVKKATDMFLSLIKDDNRSFEVKGL